VSVEPIKPGVIFDAIDPGDTESAIVTMEAESGRPPRFWRGRTMPNAEMVIHLRTRPNKRPIAIEMIASYGMPVGREVFETCVWIGRFGAECGWDCVTRIYRRDVKLYLCGQTKAKDANVSQAIRDLYGPNKAAAVGTKKKPGPLYGVSGDVWAALGVGLTFAAGAYTPADQAVEEEAA